MRTLLCSTCLTPLAILLAAGPLHAETVITTAQTAPVRTSTANSGAPADVRISSTGSLKPTSGTAITIDSNNSAKNEGTIQITGANGAIGILGNPGHTGNITNTGTITIDETFTPTDTDTDGDIDGPFAQGTDRYGIRVGSGGTFTGSILNSGTITIEGNNSAGIAVDSHLVGSLSSSGKINVTGNNSYGIHTQDVTGNVNVTGTVTAKGANAVGVAIDGDVTGAVVFQGGVSSTGYRSITPPADVSKLDADDLLQGGPAVRISGNVGGGILFDAPPKDTDPANADEDHDGTPDASEGTAAIVSYGAAPAVRIGSATGPTTIGAVAGTAAAGHGVVVNGIIDGEGVYGNVAANGLVIGGLGGTVNVAGGLLVNGSIVSTADGAASTAIRIGSGATVPEIKVTGRVVATGGASTGTPAVQGIVIDAGANVSTLRNSGTIAATLIAGGTAGAIVDKSGTLTLVENSGSISVAGTQGGSDLGLALDLRTNTSGVTVRQLVAATGAAAPVINGNILFGSGNDVLDVADGTISGTTKFGAGSNRLSLSGDAVYNGDAVFTGTDMLTLAGTSVFTGALSGNGNLAVNVTGGSLNLTNRGTVALSSLSLGAQGSMAVTIDAAAHTHTLYDVAGTASFAAGSSVNVKLTSVVDSEGSYQIVHAGTLNGGSNLASSSPALPFLFTSSLTADQGAGNITLTIHRKSATELGLNGSQARAYDAIFHALDNDASVAGVFLNIADAGTFRTSVRELLPNHAGGVFEAVTQGSRAAARILADPYAPVLTNGKWGIFLQQVGWGTTKNVGDTAAYDVTGWGVTGGAEVETNGMGRFGGSLSYLIGTDADGGTSNSVGSNEYEAAGYWRTNAKGLNAFARIAGAYVTLSGDRHFSGTSATGQTVTRNASGSWNGTLVSASAGASYEKKMGRVSIRPIVAVDYYRLSESGYTEKGGGDSVDLSVKSRTSDQMAANASLALGYNFGSTAPGGTWFRVEIEGGRRELLSGSVGSTTASFPGGVPFTLLATQPKSGWLGRIRVMGGISSFIFSSEAGVEEQEGRDAFSLRISLHFAF
jgi:hypothetical protein